MTSHPILHRLCCFKFSLLTSNPTSLKSSLFLKENAVNCLSYGYIDDMQPLHEQNPKVIKVCGWMETLLLPYSSELSLNKLTHGELYVSRHAILRTMSRKLISKEDAKTVIKIQVESILLCVTHKYEVLSGIMLIKCMPRHSGPLRSSTHS